jgi:hypothetical protein
VTGDLAARLAERLVALRAEQAAGRRVLADLQSRQAEVQDTLLRIAGAVQVLEEELAKDCPHDRPIGQDPGDDQVRAAVAGDQRGPGTPGRDGRSA